MTRPRSLWLASAPAPDHPPLGADISVDVAVVGGGITGLTAALLLEQTGRRVAVLESAAIGAGAGAASAGHVTACLDLPYSALVERFGVLAARLTADAAARAVDFIAATAPRLGVECGYLPVPGYLYAEAEEDLPTVRREMVVAAHLGLAATFVRAVPLPFPVAGAVRFAEQAQIDPVAYLRGLADRITAGKGLIFGHSRVGAVEDGTPCRLTVGGHTVQAAAVVLATHTPVGRHLSLQTRLAPWTSYLLALALDGAAPVGLFRDLAAPYHHIRSHRGLLLVGGAGHRTGDVTDGEARFDRLERFARGRFAVRSVEHRWTEQTFAPADGLPYIGLLPGAPHVLVGTGYAGAGIALGTLAGMMAAEQVIGEPGPCERVFRPARAGNVLAARELGPTSLGAAWQWVAGRLCGHDAVLVADLRPGSGRIIEIDGRRAAVYRDPGGGLHALSPTCTHAGCVVGWNAAESTWDCPCHGGRYDPLGGVLAAPPVADLAHRLLDPGSRQ